MSEVLLRAVARSENPGVPVLFDGHNLPPMVEIGLRWLPKLGVDMSTRPHAHRRTCSNENINTGVFVVFKIKHGLKCQNGLFLKHITEIV